MKKFYKDYKGIINKYPEMTLGKIENKIEESFKIYGRQIYKTKGNRKEIAKLLKAKDLTVNEIAHRIKMTRQGVRYHIHKLESEGIVFKKEIIGEGNIIYSFKE